MAAAVGVPALVLCVGLCLKVTRDRAATSERREELAQIEKEITVYRDRRRDLEQFFSKPETRLVTQRAAFLNGIIDERSFPWTQFFLDLERRLPGGVRILSLAPSLAGDHLQVKMRVAALSDKSKLDFLQGLEKAPEFSSIEVVSESPVAKGEDLDVVQVDLSAEYRALPAGRKGAGAGGAP
ncbi:MAG TPA: hypothetical protein VJW51_07675 [Candidatus Acidoferrales bacterium]|nr:hypothetical protein [Candidatus Acidoferrales bacterium]